MAHKSEGDDYNVSVGSNFHIPDKTSEKSNHIIIKHIDDMLEILKEQASNEVEDEEEPEATLTYMIHTNGRP